MSACGCYRYNSLDPLDNRVHTERPCEFSEGMEAKGTPNSRTQIVMHTDLLDEVVDDHGYAGGLDGAGRSSNN